MNYSKVIKMSPDKLVDSSRASPRTSESGSKRMTIQFSPELAGHLEWIASLQGISQAEAVRKAVALESYLRQALNRNGARLLIEDNDSIKEVIIR